jgi:hypothetical protein
VLEFDYEYSDTEFVYSQIYSLTDTEKDYREISTQLQFWTGGVPGVPRTNFIQLAVSAWDKLANVALPPTNITMWSGAYQKRCDSSGNVYISGADNTWYTCTPEADHAVYSNYTFGVTPSIAYLAISRGGSDITGQTNTVIVGEQITLTCLFVDAATNAYNIAPITNFQWSIPGSTVSNYIPSTPVSLLHSNLNTTNASIYFYWYQPGTDLEVQCTAISKGVTMTMKTKFNVVAPSYTLSICPSNAVALDNNYFPNGLYAGDALHFGDGRTNHGVVFRATAGSLVETNFDLAFCQTMADQATVWLSSGWRSNRFISGILDNPFPYSSRRDTNDLYAIDSPGIAAGMNLDGIQRSDQFDLYLLYQHPGGIWVPLSVASWSWSGLGTNTPQWTLVSSSQITNCVSGSSNPGFPFWTNTYSNGRTNWISF